MRSTDKKILIIVSHYLPGYKYGGPLQTIQNICALYKERASIYVLTQNFDHNDSIEYDFPVNEWIDYDGIKVKYLKNSKFSYTAIKEEMKEADCILACDFFAVSTLKTILINRFSKDKKTLYIAPMGVFNPKAFSSKRLKKRIASSMLSHLGMLDYVTWSFSSEIEHVNTKTVLGESCVKNYIIAEDLPRKVAYEEYLNKECRKKVGEIRIVFLSRISPMKNLDYAIRLLEKIEDKVAFDIYGYIDDRSYWNMCMKLADRLPKNISFRYCGGTHPADSVRIFSNYDIFLFPTKGENYGHVIYEALSAGCIPIISNNTLWTDIDDKNCGNAINLECITDYRNVLKHYIDMGKDEMDQYRRNAILYAKEKYQSSTHNSGFDHIFIE